MKIWSMVWIVWVAFVAGAFAQEPIRVACVGNSITQGPGRDNINSFPLMMQKLLGDAYEVKNFGVSGSTLLKKGDLPYWDQPQYKEALDFKPDILVIKLGTNDSKPQNWAFKEEFLADYQDMLSVFTAVMPEGGKIYVCLPVPVFEDNWGITESVIVKEMTPQIKKAARAAKASIIDLHKPFTKKKGLFPDGVHPNAEGNAQMAEIIAERINN
ncbi:GDSL-type esterase/lipase family protein [Lunatimonas sp.]|uniref:GDSL-type esterase/lipase family protein n=1 Tax=Lunatimonas sp. TaxID=2060141 RepID=UPI00263A9622|nr:GDSL-type esterase/lipase family protein [Lunatimonas sp.]